jgi:hypothetical protein
MKNWDRNITSQSRPQSNSGERSLVVRHAEDKSELEDVLQRLERLEKAPETPLTASRKAEHGEASRFDLRTMAAVAAILLSMAGYVVEDARNTSRQDAEIESTKVRVTNLEKIANANTEARIRTEVQLGELKEGQSEIKQMIRAHEDQTAKILRKK